MEEIRKAHNQHKRDLIEAVTREADAVLDVGCGFGGDLQKWRARKVGSLNMCDPSRGALQEAKTRARNMKIHVNFYEGDITACPNRKFDVICFNFSLHYIFATRELFETSLKEIRKRAKPGCRLCGIIPDSTRLIWRCPIKDELGNWFMLRNTSNGEFGEKVFVELKDTPFYADGPKSEPLAHKDALVTGLEEHGFELQTWEHLQGAEITELYAKFIFVFKK